MLLHHQLAIFDSAEPRQSEKQLRQSRPDEAIIVYS